MNKRPSAKKVKAENRKRVLAAYEGDRRVYVGLVTTVADLKESK